jgi:tetratricopeptide (TPR) repeat protein
MTWMWGMRAESMARNYLGQHDQAGALANRWMELAERAGSVEYLAWGRTMQGWLSWTIRGNLPAARRDLEWAVARFEQIDHPVGLPYSLNVLGNVMMGMGEHAAARPIYDRVLALAQKHGNLKMQGYVLTNLGTLEARFGDPARSLQLHRRGMEIWLRLQDQQAVMVEMSNVVQSALSLGRVDEARRIATEALALAEKEGMALEIPWQRGSLADALWAGGRTEEAKRLWRSVVTMGDTVAVDPRAIAAHGLATALAEQDSLAEAGRVVERALVLIGTGADLELRGKLAVLAAELATAGGRPAAGLAAARPLAHELHRKGQHELALAAWTQVVVASRRLGRTAEAAAAIDSATAIWEEGRSVATDLEFREMRGEQARRLALERLLHEAAHLPGRPEGERLAVAFENLQRFKTRTLLERMAGARAFADSASAELETQAVDLRRFQGEVLGQDELYLEYVVGPDTTALLAITRDAFRLIRLPGEKHLAGLDLARGLFETAPGAGSAVDAAQPAQARLGEQLLAGVDDLLAGSRTVWIAPDGPLHRVPFAALVPPGGGEPLLVTHRVAIAPSAAILAALKSRAAGSSGRLFAFEGGASRTRPALPGARREVGSIARRFFDVEVMRAETRGKPLDTVTLAGFGALHFAAHTRIDGQVPWRSGVIVGAGADGEDSLLTAAEIAAGDLGAPLVVLSSCESAGGRARSGEGVAGLGAAFLSAGAPAVVATLWPVDDRPTARLMEVFYREVARGTDPTNALRLAQLELRRAAATAHPFYWAGFVIVGDGDRPLALRARPYWMQLPFASALVVMLVLLIARFRRARRDAAARPAAASPEARS